ncbi:MAG TPA: hypothetical protein P5210_00215 [Draconibacterium sp.]|nr:hypothetical protein [Draconibacterium sp.]HRX10036.1 hypothetical protein [Draconibacterium sp.]
MKKYIQNLLIVVLIITILSWLVFSKIAPQYYLPVYPFIVLFYVVTSVLLFAYQIRLAEKDMGKFTRSIMLITFVKLILYSALAVLYIALDKENAKIFAVCYMSLYAVFTVFEVFSLLKITAIGKKDG